MTTVTEVSVSVGRRWVYGPITHEYLDEIKAIEEARPSPEFIAFKGALLDWAAGVPFTREGDKLIFAPCAIVRDGAETRIFFRGNSP